MKQILKTSIAPITALCALAFFTMATPASAGEYCRKDVTSAVVSCSFDTLAQCHSCHAAACASTTQAKIGGIILDSDEIGPTAMCRNAWIDLLLEDLHDPLSHVSAEVHRRSGHPRACAGRARWLIGILNDHSALVCITVDVLEKCLDRVALAIDQAGDKGAVYLPIYDRLEAELKALKDKEDRVARIRARVKR